MNESKRVVEYMTRNSLKLVTAESCTAGLIASHLAEVPGAGKLLDCAYVVYSPAAKQRCLNVNADTIERYGLTSEEVAREMALGALANGEVNLAVANTGVTDDVDPQVPAGTQCFAWAFRRDDGTVDVFSQTRRFDGSRNEMREAAAGFALRRIPELHREQAS